MGCPKLTYLSAVRHDHPKLSIVKSGNRDFSFIGKEVADAYVYGFNGMEKDDEVKGKGNSYTTPFRILDPRLGRWLSIDPVTHHHMSPYCTFDNNPIYFSDPRGSNSDPKVDEPQKNAKISKSSIKKSEIKANDDIKFIDIDINIYVISSDRVKTDDKGKIVVDEALETGYQNALKSGATVIVADDYDDFVTQLDDLDASAKLMGMEYKINSLILDSHGYYENSKFSIGNSRFQTNAEFKLLKYLTPYMSENGYALLGSCHFAGGLDPEASKNTSQYVANRLGRPVIANMGWTGASFTKGMTWNNDPDAETALAKPNALKFKYQWIYSYPSTSSGLFQVMLFDPAMNNDGDLEISIYEKYKVNMIKENAEK